MPAASARGPENIVHATENRAGVVVLVRNHDGLLLSDGVDVDYEHSETWGWHSGESVRLAFVSVHRVEDDKITLWKDYSDFNTLSVPGAAVVHRRLRVCRHVVGVRRDRSGLTDGFLHAPGQTELLGEFVGAEISVCLLLVAAHRDDRVDRRIAEDAADQRGSVQRVDGCRPDSSAAV